MDMSRLYIFDPEFPEDTSYEIRFEKSLDYLVIEGSERNYVAVAKNNQRSVLLQQDE